MNKFVQHVPTFCDGCEPKSFFFSSQEDLVRELGGLGYGNGVGKYFELSGNTIMEVSDNGYHWWVAGYVSSTEGLTFNKWEAKYKPVKTKEQLQAEGITTYNPEDITIKVGGITFEGFSGDIVTIERKD